MDLAFGPHRRRRVGRSFAVVSGLVVVAAIVFLTFNVSREVRLLGSANSDNVQWSLAQTEVEFLEFATRLGRTDPDLSDLRRKFDVFYSRIATLRQADVFADLRKDATFRSELGEIQAFLEETVPVIDASDADLQSGLPDLRDRAEVVRGTVRGLSTAGLDLFAVASDTQRREVASTMMELAVALAILIGMLALAVLYLVRLIRTNQHRERQQAQTANRMKAILGTSLDGVIVSDAKGRIVTFSPAAEAIFGYRAEDVIGRDLGRVIVPPHLRDAHDAGMARMRAGGEKRVVGKGRVRLEAMRADGDLFPVELSIQSSVTDAGQIFIAFLRDISRRVADEAELVAARDTALANEKLKTEFLATMSHEIRTPLNGLLGNMDLLRDTQLSPQQARFMRNMDTSGRLLMRHISDVLDITRYDAGKMSTRSEPMNLSILLQDIVDSQTGMAAANKTALEWGWEGEPQNWIKSDHDRLQHVLMNLVGNAVKFTRDGKITLTVQAKPAGERIELCFAVTDTGPGMAPDLAARVFDDFVTGNAAYDREVGGTGLGLSIAKRFVRALDGEIGVDSTLGQGSTFWVKLPVVPAEPAAAKPVAKRAALPPVPGPVRPLDVLVVEDNEINRTVARDMLEASGHRVTLAVDGQRGVACAATRRFDLILMDISMPVMDGRTATRAIRQGAGPSSASPIVALTANAMREEQENFMTDGMNGILMKPLSKAALAEVLATHGQASAVAPTAVSAEPAAPDRPAASPTPASDVGPAPAAPADDTAPVLDAAHNAEARDVMGAAGYEKFLGRFVKEVDDLLEGVRDAADTELDDIAARAHKVAGSAAVFGAVALRERLKAVEAAAKAGGRDAVAASLAGLDALWARTRAALSG
ncbi:PAS domain-containing hybrid sensor histidine kinase/response regulator [Salipiger sp. IMCC34102]|nr:PAS domain-containing hybrid sensor histidine kinase/response regulator [Salipiger sp. IMCC34102]